jgi:methylamine dehydrogenase heavy chain
MTLRTAMKRTTWAAALLATVWAFGSAAAPLQAEQRFVEQLGARGPHWIFVYDANAFGYLDSKVYLFDADTGAMLGMLSTGTFGNAVEFAPDFSAIYVPEIYYSRGTRGERTDVVSIYDTTNLAPVGEVIIPPKRATGIPHRAYQGISDDGRFVFVANMTPATSVSVVDVVARRFVTEIEIAGCNLVYPTGNRSFATLCGDGTLGLVQLDEQGNVKAKSRTAKFFDPEKDPLTEKASRVGDTWMFFSFDGYVHPVKFSAGKAEIGKRWSLFSDKERQQNWKVGGQQFNAVHQGLGRLYVIVHQGGAYGHKDAGKDVWVYDLATKKGIAQFSLANPASNLSVTKDAAPLLSADDPARPAIDIYDALTGAALRTIEGPPSTPSFIQSP